MPTKRLGSAPRRELLVEHSAACSSTRQRWLRDPLGLVVSPACSASAQEIRTCRPTFEGQTAVPSPRQREVHAANLEARRRPQPGRGAGPGPGPGRRDSSPHREGQVARARDALRAASGRSAEPLHRGIREGDVLGRVHHRPRSGLRGRERRLLRRTARRSGPRSESPSSTARQERSASPCRTASRAWPAT